MPAPMLNMALLAAALGFLQLRQPPAEVALLRRWLDGWRGLGLVVEAMERRWDVSLTPLEYVHNCKDLSTV